MPPRTGAFAPLLADHEDIRRHLDALELEADPDETRRIIDQTGHLVHLHLRLEELVLYPLLHERLANEEERVALFGAKAEHELIQLALEGLGREQPVGEVFRGRVHALNLLWCHHVEVEEDALLVLAQRVVPPAGLAELVHRLRVTKRDLVEGTAKVVP